MLWSRSAPPAPPAAPAHVPDAQALLRTALRASWQRDQRVGRRRLALRWMLWAFWRYGLPLLLVLTAAVAVWLWLLPGLHQSLAVSKQDRPAQPTAPTASQHAPAATGPYETATDAITLRLEPSWSPSPIPSTAAGDAPAATQTVRDPSPKPENWLHSKEP
ncbi:MAG: hypothetical protein Q8K21_02385 [Hydrogenophaga sp.]|uniref:hypothetical protein n=1 Tax=Hydrogenophaga sp. TaxID=1904254 RepID=UPI0027317C68|nr:hypothetical protein [Hydrogenophaga sp.]MDP2163064.1 hypothetical protein [Hydrogenophaga sp.]MDP3477458.1 hypothetical protein [Hydrogenophaga sp.]